MTTEENIDLGTRDEINMVSKEACGKSNTEYKHQQKEGDKFTKKRKIDNKSPEPPTLRVIQCSGDPYTDSIERMKRRIKFKEEWEDKKNMILKMVLDATAERVKKTRSDRLQS
jgi:hypothetical protein